MKKTYKNLEVITGCMFSGKTKELILRLEKYKLDGYEIIVFKPIIDQRYSANEIVAHSGEKMNCYSISSPKEILNYPKNYKVIGIDETQFFDHTIVEVVKKLIKTDTILIIAGLNLNFNKQPFGAMPKLIKISNTITQLFTNCIKCGEKASYTFKKKDIKKLIEIGAGEMYEPRCETCYNLG